MWTFRLPENFLNFTLRQSADWSSIASIVDITALHLLEICLGYFLRIVGNFSVINTLIVAFELLVALTTAWSGVREAAVGLSGPSKGWC
jgi:hypothetical protein